MLPAKLNLVVTPIVAFVKEHWPLALFAVVLAVLFLFVGHFAELLYGAIRLTCVMVFAAAIVNLVFKGTLRPYINDGIFVTDFHGLPPVQKVWLTVAVIIALVFVAALCFALP